MDAHPNTIVRLAMAKKDHPGLNEVLAQANLTLAAAILDMDATSEPALAEQAAVEQATAGYAQALADLLQA